MKTSQSRTGGTGQHEAGSKLYVWEGVLTDYTSGVMFALAESAKQAREIIYREYLRPARGWRTKLIDKESSVWKDLQSKPLVVKSPKGFLCWGGG